MLIKNNIIEDIKNIIPKENVFFDLKTCYSNSIDKSIVMRTGENLAEIVIFPQNTEDVINIVKLANKYLTPITCRGAGTNTVGACIPVQGGIVLNFEKMNKILEINSQNMSVTVQPGVVVGDIQKEVEKIGLFYPPDPAKLDVSTIGGSIAQNSAGARCFKYGATKDYILELKVVTGRGELITVGAKTAKNSTGYNVSSLFVGSEGTLGIVVEATLKLIPKPQAQQVITAYFDCVEDSISTVNDIISAQLYPSTIDFMDKNALKTVELYTKSGLLCEKEALLLIEIDGIESSIDEQRFSICKIIENNGGCGIKYSTNEVEREQIWSARRVSMTACSKLKPNVTTDDVIVPRENLAKLVYGVQDICEKYELNLCLIGHVGDGSVHPQIPIDIEDEEEYKRYRKAKAEIYDLTASLGGLLSGEHGIGVEKQKYITKVVDNNVLCYMKDIKALFDPNNILNPSKIF